MSIKEIASADAIPENFKEIGHVSATGSTVDDVTASLAEKAVAMGGVAFKVVAVGGNNQLHGNAIVYSDK